MPFDTGLPDEKVEELYLAHRQVITGKVNVASRTYCKHIDHDVLESHALQAFIRVCRNWKVDGGASFSTLLHRSIERELRDLAKRKAEALERGWSKKEMFALQITDEMSELLSSGDYILKDAALDVEAFRGKLSVEALEFLRSVLSTSSLTKAQRECAITSKKRAMILLKEACEVVFQCSFSELEERARKSRMLVE